jgi:hypothetical protein
MAGESGAEVEKTVEALLARIQLLRQEADERGETFEALDEEQLRRKVRGETAQSPFFTSHSWVSGVPPGSSIPYTADIYNPDPGYWSSLLCYVFFGPANSILDPDLALASKIDERFSYSYRQTSLYSGQSATLPFTVRVASAIAPGDYLGNCFLMVRRNLDVGRYFGRASFLITIT